MRTIEKIRKLAKDRVWKIPERDLSNALTIEHSYFDGETVIVRRELIGKYLEFLVVGGNINIGEAYKKLDIQLMEVISKKLNLTDIKFRFKTGDGNTKFGYEVEYHWKNNKIITMKYLGG